VNLFPRNLACLTKKRATYLLQSVGHVGKTASFPSGLGISYHKLYLFYPPSVPAHSPSTPLASPPPESSASEAPPSEGQFGSRVRSILQTPQNIFGLFQRYLSGTSPSHNPEEYRDLLDLCDEPTVAPLSHPPDDRNNFEPFPNKNSFLLADWYWNHGIQKSSKSFKDLLNIVGHPEFLPDDVQQTNWVKLDSKLAANNFDGGDCDNDREWMDQDAGWRLATLFSVRLSSWIRVWFPHGGLAI
jgi:hypothetical protein